MITVSTGPVSHQAPPKPRPQAALQCGTRVVFGIQPQKPIRGAPEGWRKLLMRAKVPARLIVKNGCATYVFVLVDKGDHWLCDPKMEQGRNVWVNREFNKTKKEEV